MEDSVFTKIINGKIPSYKVYEDERTLAFLDIHPSHEGKTLVISKKQVDQFIDLPQDDYIALWQTVRKVSLKLREVYGKDRIGVVIKGVEVPHAHVHLIPFNNDEQLRADDEITDTPSTEELASTAAKIAF